MTGRQARLVGLILTAAAILSSERWLVCRCEAAGDDEDYDGNGDQRTKALSNPLVANLFYGKIRNMTRSFSKDTEKKLDYCIKDSDKDWNKAFNFSSDLTFVARCMKETNGDMGQRVCTAAEMKFYFNSFYEQQNYLKPNLNCNLTSWVSGCEPGWGCSAGNQKINLQDSKTVPLRTLDCRPCCAGFFCPHGLTCMIRKLYMEPLLFQVACAIAYLILSFKDLCCKVVKYCIMNSWCCLVCTWCMVRLIFKIIFFFDGLCFSFF